MTPLLKVSHYYYRTDGPPNKYHHQTVTNTDGDTGDANKKPSYRRVMVALRVSDTLHRMLSK